MSGTAVVPAEWAQVEIFGHRRHFGRIEEVERFGSKMLRIDEPTEDPLRFNTFFYGGASIFSVTPCTEESARAFCERYRPRPYRAAEALPPPEQGWSEEDEEP
jgi:hypothetical protein